jgi:hypothetical protein
MNLAVEVQYLGNADILPNNCEPQASVRGRNLGAQGLG